ncbi:MAG: FKBP-type peptidyl-prolyl cis-trans isomerase [Bacteroidales bacterium]|nr:FKBP-type peptidyl-prolyl cis-trans isomerase [Bacteroidales bacterium]
MDKISYALGMSIAHNLLRSGVKEINTEDFSAAIKATLSGEKPALSFEEAGTILDDFFKELEETQKKEQEAAGKVFKKQGEDFLEANKKEDGVVVLPSGLQYKVIKKGTGAKPKATDQVVCHYEGTLVDGTKFDSSWDRNQPAQFGLNQVIPGWTEGLQLMNEGSEYMLYIPYKLGYGEAGAHGAIPPYAALIFRVELIKVVG